MAYRRVNTHRHGDRNSDEQAGESEFQSRRQPLGDELDYRLAEFERAAEVAAHGTREEIPILDQQWLSNPSSARSFATSSGVALSPSINVTGSPGAICTKRKIKNEIANKTGRAPINLRMSLFMEAAKNRFT